jgi:amino acid transporter
LTGFLFAWSQLSVTRSGSIASMAYIFGKAAQSLFGFAEPYTFAFAALSVFALTVVNILGVRMGTRTQNVLTVAKVIGLLALILVGLFWGDSEGPPALSHASASDAWFIGAMIFVLWTYSGWHEAAYVVAEAKNHTRNIPLALMIGTLIVTGIYVAVNLAFLGGLGFEGAKDERATVKLVELAFPDVGARVMNVLIMISALGAINGMIFTTARIYTAFGADHRIFKTMSHWSKRWRTPARALAVQGLICLAIIAGVWFFWGKDPFDVTVKLTVAVFSAFFALTGVSLIVLREREPDVPRPFRAPGYPVLPLIFSAWWAFVAAKTIFDEYQKGEIASLIGVGILLLGLPFYFIPRKLREHKPAQELEPVSK